MRLFSLALFAFHVPLVAGREEPDESPVTKVVSLLEELQKKVEADGVAEQAMFDKYACWCEETTSRKSANIVDAQKEMKRIGTSILALKGTVNVRTAEIAKLNKQIKDNEAAQSSATTIRQKENAKFSEEKAEMEKTIGSLEKGIMTLKGAGTKSASLLERKGMLAQMAAHLKTALKTFPVEDSLSPEQLHVVGAFLSDPSEYYDQKAQKAASYNPASTTIIGILKDMYDTFATNLEKSTIDEGDAQKSFEDIMAVKEKEAATLTAELEMRETEKAEAAQMLADASQELDDTSKQMKVDMEFFDDTKRACSMKADDWAERVRARTEELAGIAKALEILTSDDAKALFSKAIKPGMEKSFLQVGDAVMSAPRKKVLEALNNGAKKTHSLRLAALASKVKEGGHFDVVVEEIDSMLDVLKKEEKDDINHRDWCKEEIFANEQETSRYEYKIGKTEAKIKKLENQLEEFEDLLDKTTGEMEDTLKEMKDMEDERVEEHKKFEQAKSDDEQAVVLLDKAIDSLKSYYKNNPPAFLQEETASQARQALREDPDEPPEMTMTSKSKTSGETGGIVGIMEMLKEDLEAEITNGIEAEKDAQKEFETAMAQAQRVLKKLGEKKTNLKQSISDTNQRTDDRHKEKDDFDQLLIEEKAALTELKPDCDWILEQFYERRSKRDQEMEGLVEAKSMMQGAMPETLLVQNKDAFLQRH